MPSNSASIPVDVLLGSTLLKPLNNPRVAVPYLEEEAKPISPLNRSLIDKVLGDYRGIIDFCYLHEPSNRSFFGNIADISLGMDSYSNMKSI